MFQRGQSGVGQYVLALTRALASFGNKHQFTLFVLEEDCPRFAGLGDAFRIVSVPERFRPPLRNIFWHQTALPRLARKARLDVVHVPSYRRLVWGRPCARVATIHDLAVFSVRRKYDPGRMFYGRVVAKKLACRQEQIIAISQNTARDIERYFGVQRDSVTVIHNGLDHARFHPGPAEPARQKAAEQFGLDRPFLIYVARLEHPGKNHLRLVAAFEEFKRRTRSNWLLALAGSDWHSAEVIHDCMERSPRAADIRRLGFVADADVPTLYRAAEALVFPSLFEGFGMPVTEAMACGCPVISSDRGALRELVEGVAAIIDPEDVESMAGQMVALAVDARMRERMREAGLRRAEDFSWDRTATETMRVYQRAAQGRALNGMG